MIENTQGPRTASAWGFEDMLASLLTMAWMVEARDPYTAGHLWRVSKLASLVAREAGMTGPAIARVTLGGFLHDIGKVGIPDAVLNKNSRLDDREFDTIKTHPEIGARMLEGHPLADLVMDAVLYHHERPDGRGYPEGLSGDEIPDAAKIIGICDAFDAMTSTRPYRRGMPIEKATSIVRDNLGTQFDTTFGTHFLNIPKTDILHVVGHSSEGIPLLECKSCGPTITACEIGKPGDTTFCRVCGGEFALQEGGESVEWTGKMGSAADLYPKPERGMIASVVRELAENISQELGA